MRLYGESQTYTKKIVTENYETFNNIVSNKKFFLLAIIYVITAIVGAVLEIIDGGLVLGIIDVVVHGLIAWGLFQFSISNSKVNDKFSTKGLTKIQVVHAVKYTIIVVSLILLIVMFVLKWSTERAQLAKAYTSIKGSIDKEEVELARAKLKAVFPTYFPVLLMLIVVFFSSTVYYGSVMRVIDGTVKYNQKGTHFWNELKFAGIFLFVVAGIMIAFGVGFGLDLFDKFLPVAAKMNLTKFIGGTGMLSMVARILYGLSFAFLGFIFLKDSKVLLNTETTIVTEINVTDDLEEEFSQLDSTFYEYPENITEIVNTFLDKNRSELVTIK